MTIELTKDCALVLVGPQGSGKTRLAEKIASKYWQALHLDCMTRGALAHQVAHSESAPTVIIFDNPDETDLPLIRGLNGGDWSIRTPQRTIVVATPVFVIVTTTVTNLVRADYDHAFYVLPIAEARRLMGEPS